MTANWSIWFAWSVSSVWFLWVKQQNKPDGQMDKMNQDGFSAAC